MPEATPVVSTFTATVSGVTLTAPTQDELVSLVLKIQPVLDPVPVIAPVGQEATKPEKTFTARAAGHADEAVRVTVSTCVD